MADVFKDKAADFDAGEIPRRLSAGIGSSILERVELDGAMHVMDFGAGTGLVSAHIAGKVGSLTAVDVSEAMLEELASKPALHGKVDVVCQDILRQPLGKRFDLIVSAMAMHHVEDTDELIRCFAEHLKPGAKLALADLDQEDGSFHPPDMEGVYHCGFDRDALRALLDKRCFDDVDFTSAVTVEKEAKQYSVFLVVATKR